mmetsp:Transcript_35794/g.55858  ORF Transcript_35794/g.55858 Transcript_35794/m.55858 type:complete len:184 (-) Transcript_35794:59-610(-)
MQSRSLQLDATEPVRPAKSLSFSPEVDFKEQKGKATENSRSVGEVTEDLFQVLSGRKAATESIFFEWPGNSLADARNKLDDGGVHQLHLLLKIQEARQALHPDLTWPQLTGDDTPTFSPTTTLVVRCCRIGCGEFQLVSEPLPLVSEEDLKNIVVDRLEHVQKRMRQRADHIKRDKKRSTLLS